MKLSFKVFGFEIATVNLEMDLTEIASDTANGAVSKGVKGISKLWFKGMTK